MILYKLVFEPLCGHGVFTFFVFFFTFSFSLCLCLSLFLCLCLCFSLCTFLYGVCVCTFAWSKLKARCLQLFYTLIFETGSLTKHEPTHSGRLVTNKLQGPPGSKLLPQAGVINIHFSAGHLTQNLRTHIQTPISWAGTSLTEPSPRTLETIIFIICLKWAVM